MDTSQIVAILSLVVAAISLVGGFLHGGRTEVERYQKLNDSVDNVARGIDDLKETVTRMDAKLDRHDAEIVRIETKIEDHDRRLAHIEGRCERHFGQSEHTG